MNQLNMFKFLNRLRATGKVNMFGASQYIAEAFDIGGHEARKVLTDWMQWVNENPDNLEK